MAFRDISGLEHPASKASKMSSDVQPTYEASRMIVDEQELTPVEVLERRLDEEELTPVEVLERRLDEEEQLASMASKMSPDQQTYWAELDLLAESGENLVEGRERSLKALSLYAILQFAIQMGEIKVMKSCFGLGIPMNYEVSKGKTPLLLGIESNRPEVIKFLISLGVDVNRRTTICDSPLHYAVDQKKESALIALLKNTRNRILINSLGSDGLAPLHRATKNQQRQMITILAKYGADINVKGEGGSTPLHIAAECNYCIEFTAAAASSISP